MVGDGDLHVGFAGGPGARSRKYRPGSTLCTLVESLTTAGQVPTEWCTLEPGAGQVGSTSLIRDAPTTHNPNNQLSDNTANTDSGAHVMSRDVTAVPYLPA